VTGIRSGTLIQRGDVVDHLTTDDGAVVLLRVPGGHELVRLSDLGAAVFDLLAAPQRVDALVRPLLEEFGEPPGADALTTVISFVEELVDNHVVVAADS
jgi:hypothetical protein